MFTIPLADLYASLRQRRTVMLTTAMEHGWTFDDTSRVLFTKWLIEQGRLGEDVPSTTLIRPQRRLGG